MDAKTLFPVCVAAHVQKGLFLLDDDVFSEKNGLL